MNEEREFKYHIKKKQINELIQSILTIRRQEANENINETPEIKLGRRLKQRSYEKLSKEILEHIITRYEIDNDKLPSREKLIELMINFLGNIQKTSDYYNLKNGKKVNPSKTNFPKVGLGFNGEIYSIKPDKLITKKKRKTLAFKSQKKGIPYNIDIHISSALLLAFYDFQPKYYNQYYMEIGKYENKSKERIFIKVQMNFINFKEVTANNIGWYILFNFTNIRDQVHNIMLRTINEEFIKIDIRTFNSEGKESNIKKILEHILNYIHIFKKNKKTLINELNKILIINEEYLVDLVIFRVKRGCFNNINKKDLSINFDCVSSSYKVVKFNNSISFSETYENYIKTFNNNHFENNLALSWLLYNFFNNKVLTNKEYDYYIQKFNEKAEKFEQIAKKIRNKDIVIFNIKEKAIDIEEKVSDNKNKKLEDNAFNFEQDKEDNIENKEYGNDELPKFEDLELKTNHKIEKRRNIKNNKNNINTTSSIEIKKNKEQNNFCLFCCGKESVDVID